jgi:hypothetical protein
MIATNPNMRRRLEYILHEGFVEIRNLAYGGNHKQIAELADAMEILPRFLEECSAEDMEMARFVLRNYHRQYPQSRYRYLEILEGCQDIPERF